MVELNNRVHQSRGRACRAGDTAISVAADGTARRCHFTAAPIGNIFSPDFENALRPRPCPVASCRCHIGYSHLEGLGLDALFAGGFVERRAVAPDREQALAALARFDAGGP